MRASLYLLAVDVAGIQRYIYRSNRLRENVGASFLVARFTQSAALRLLAETVDEKTNLIGFEPPGFDESKSVLHQEDLRAEVVFAGGGSLVVVFSDRDDRNRFVRALSLKALEEAPGLDLVFATADSIDRSALISDLARLLRQTLPAAREGLVRSAELGALPVSRVCASTGTAAAGWIDSYRDTPKRPLSSESIAKIGAGRSADQWLSTTLDPGRGDVEYPSELDDLGRTRGESSYMAVVRLDGDGMGERLAALIDAGMLNPNPAEVLSTLRRFSVGLADATRQAVEGVVRAISEAVTGSAVNVSREWGAPALELSSMDGRVLLPARPLVLGGDDITLVCDGRLGLWIAARCAAAFRDATATLPSAHSGLRFATASAGVAIVKTHYPFFRAYRLAEDLLENAKHYRREIIASTPGWEGACIDWHLEQGGLTQDLHLIRDREYQTPSGKLQLRPLTLGDNPAEVSRSFQVVKAGIEAFLGPAWMRRRNKVKTLRTALRQGPPEVERFLQSLKDQLPELPPGSRLDARYTNTGWSGGRCLYFDALEMIDLYMEPATPASESTNDGGEG